MRLAVLGLALLPITAGCMFQNLSSAERLRDAVVGYNDECRWGRIDLAAQRVMPTFREQFRLSHHNWGRGFQIADSEIVHVATAGDDIEQAMSTVVVRWYDQRTMLLADSTLQQTWTKVRGGYVLLQEQVVGGEVSLLEIPPELVPAEPAGEPAEPTDESASTRDAEAALSMSPARL